MKFRATDFDFICAKAGDGLYDLLVYNPTRRELFCEEQGVEEDKLRGVDSYGDPYAAVEVSPKTWKRIFDKLFEDAGSFSCFFDDEDEPDPAPPKRPKIPEEKVRQGLAGELSYEELEQVIQGSFARADYYQFETFMSVIHRFLDGRITRNYYAAWTIAVAMALYANPFRENSKKALLYATMSDCFDGHSFLPDDEKLPIAGREMIAYLKFYNHLRTNLRKSEESAFYNENNIAVYICFAYCNHHNSYYHVCVADEQNKVFRLTTVINPDYIEEVNYTFLEKSTFNELSGKYYGFFHDPCLDVHDYIRELPLLDERGNPIL